MKTVPDIKRDDMPMYVRKCYERYLEATTDQREAEKDSQGFFVGGEKQWLAAEVASRRGQNRIIASVNLCKPSVDQVVNEARGNPTGPDAQPVGSADGDAADILEGLIREYEYRCNAQQSRLNALQYACAGGRGLWEMATDYVDDTSLEQQIVIKYADNPCDYFYDPDARLPARQDARWGGRVRKFSAEALVAEYGSNLKVLNRSWMEQQAGQMMSWMQDAMGWDRNANQASVTTWTGGGYKGPYYVCEFYLVLTTQKKLRLYDDGILRFQDEAVPPGVQPKQGDDYQRIVPVRSVKKYVVTALDVLEETDWYGTVIPYFWVMGPEMWVDGKLYRLSLIDGAKDAQRLLNYTATSMGEITGTMTKAPFIGYEGVFDVQNAQGMNPWEATNKLWAYLPVKAEFVTDDNGQQQLLPLPQRNTWEAPIARLMEVGNWFVERIKGATSVFFEPSIPSAQAVQSGAAIRELQQQTNIGTAFWQDQMQNTTQLEYMQAALIFPQILDGQRVKTIVRPDGKHELVTINQMFPPEEMVGGKHRKADGTMESTNNIAIGKYSLRVKAGPKQETRTKEALNKLLDLVKVAPALLGNPQALAYFVRLVGEGNPQIEAFADLIAPDLSGQMTSDQQAQALAQSQQKIQLLTQAIQALNTKIQTKQPDLDLRAKEALLDSLTKIEVAKINASKDTDSQLADILANKEMAMVDMAHDVAMDATARQHEMMMAQQSQMAQPEMPAPQETA